LSNGKKDLSIFQWKFNPDTGEYERHEVPLIYIKPDDFWDRWVKYEDYPFEQWREWEKLYTYYNEDVLDAIDMVVDDMDSFPEATTIIKQIKRNIGGNDETGVDKQSD
jgi:hypothetical protein